jgi:serine/threonine-protein kinase
MGAILQGRDLDLGREIAVKVLLDQYQHDDVVLRRFVEEAQICGQLQHPSIVPIYEMGQLPDRRPYFSMKLIRGQTLARVLAGCKYLKDERPRLLRVFEQVCQALAYAHSRGVVHRDLKPANVMVGAFGEVQVMDWGLAKVLPRGGAGEPPAQGEQPDESGGSVRTVRSSPENRDWAAAQTQAGSVLGTPAYMAPEQARGELDRLDERVDVFALGAILFELLTGQPAYAGSDVRAVLAKAARAELTDAFYHLSRCGANSELIELVKRCLSENPADRPRDAGVLVQELTAYLQSAQERARLSELEQARISGEWVEKYKHQAWRAFERGAVVVALGMMGLLMVLSVRFAWNVVDNFFVGAFVGLLGAVPLALLWRRRP